MNFVLVCYDKVRYGTLADVIPCLVVVRVVDHTCLFAPESCGSAAVEVDGLCHAEHLADICSLIDACTVALILEASVDDNIIDVALLVCSHSSTWMSLS